MKNLINESVNYLLHLVKSILEFFRFWYRCRDASRRWNSSSWSFGQTIQGSKIIIVFGWICSAKKFLQYVPFLILVTVTCWHFHGQGDCFGLGKKRMVSDGRRKQLNLLLHNYAQSRTNEILNQERFEKRRISNHGLSLIRISRDWNCHFLDIDTCIKCEWMCHKHRDLIREEWQESFQAVTDWFL